MPSTQAWSLIAIGEGLGFEESGIVARYTGQLKQERVQCFYLSTFFHDLVLVPSTRCEQVLAVLNRG